MNADSRVAKELERLCRACGMCCDGSLFGFVGLKPEEIEPARRGRLRVVRADEGFEQPCAALVPTTPSRSEERTCAVYAERPSACHAFTCRLYERHRREGGDVEHRLAAVQRVRALVAELEASRLGPGHFEGERAASSEPPDERARRAYAELTRRVEEDFARGMAR